MGSRRKSSFNGSRGGLGDEDLAAMGAGRDPGNLMERKGYVVAINRSRLSRVHSHPHLDFASGRPGVGRQCQLAFQTCCDRLSCIRKSDEQRVALGPYVGASVSGHRGPEQLVMDR